jgi:MFS family permease
MPAVSPPRLGRRRILLIAAVNLVGLGSLTAPAIAGLPVKLAAFLPAEERAAALAAVLAAGALSALVANPVFGALSDRTRSRLGRRRPWILGGALTGVAAIAGLATADSPLLLGVWWVLAQVSYNAMLAGAAALLADLVPDRQRGSASGLFTAAAFVGALPPLLLATFLPAHVDAVSFVMPLLAVAVAVAALTLPDHPAAIPRDAERGGIRSAGVSRRFVAVWFQRLAMQSAFSLTTAFTLYLVADRMTGSTVAATPVTTIATLIGGAGIVLGATVGGAWASRRRTYLPFLVFGSLGLAAAAGGRALAMAPVVLWAAAIVGGIGVGTYLAVNLALALRTIPPGRAGAFLGVLNVAETLPGVVGPLAAAAFLRVGSGDPLSGAGDNYVALYVAAGVLALISLAALPALRGVAATAERPRARYAPEDADVSGT